MYKPASLRWCVGVRYIIPNYFKRKPQRACTSKDCFFPPEARASKDHFFGFFFVFCCCHTFMNCSAITEQNFTPFKFHVHRSREGGGGRSSLSQKSITSRHLTAHSSIIPVRLLFSHTNVQHLSHVFHQLQLTGICLSCLIWKNDIQEPHLSDRG